MAQTLTLNEQQRGALLAAVSQPGLAVTLETYADACDAVLWLRGLVPGAPTEIPDPLLQAIQAGAMRGITTGMFGASAEGRHLLAMIGLPIRPPPEPSAKPKAE